MASSIGKLALALTASPQGLYSGLQEAGKRIDSFVTRVGGMFGRVFNASMFGDIEGGLTSGFGDVWKTVKGALFAGLGLGGDFTKEMLGKIQELYPQLLKAEALNMPAEDFMGLSKTFQKIGIDAGETGMILTRFSAKVAGMTHWGDEKNLLTRDMLDNKTTKDQLYTVLDFLSKFDNVNERMAAAKEIWGRQFSKMIPLIGMGKGAIEEYIAKQKELGNVLDQQGAGAIMRARAALPRLNQAFEGFKLRVLVAFTPLLEFFANWLGKAGGPLSRFLKELAVGVETYFSFMTHLWAEIRDGIEAAADSLGLFIRSTMSVGDEWLSTREIVANSLVIISEAIGNTWAFAQRAFAGMILTLVQMGRAVAGVVETVDELCDAIGRLIDRIAEFIAKLPIKKVLDDLGSQMEQKIKALEELMPEGWRDKLKAMKKQFSLKGSIWEMLFGSEEEEETRTGRFRKMLDSMEDFAEKIKKGIGDPGKQARDWAEAWRENMLKVAANRDAMSAWESVWGGDPRFVNKLKELGRDYTQSPAAVFGSKEAYSIEARFKTGAMTDAQRMAKIAAEALEVEKKQLEEAQRLRDLMKKAVDKLDDLPPVNLAIA